MPVVDEQFRRKLLFTDKASGITAWIVDGEYVRDVYSVEFVEGGNHYRDDYAPFIPEGDVWLEETLNVREQQYTLLHELHERALIKFKGLSYEEAHADASRVEKEAREFPERTKQLLVEVLEENRR